MKIYYKALDLRINLKSKQFLVPEFISASLMLNTVSVKVWKPSSVNVVNLGRWPGWLAVYFNYCRMFYLRK